MKLGLSLQGIDDALKNLQQASISIDKDFKIDLLEQGERLRDKAKEILEAKSQQRTSKRYWTGKLKDAIKVNIGESISWGYKAGSRSIPEGRKIFNITVGPDMRTAPYAEWLEIGHYTGLGAKYGGSWWEGYHYMEGAYSQLASGIPKQIAKTLSVTLNKFSISAGRIRHKTTGRFVAGSIN